jgi:Flavin containing amine oxidoreductase
MSCEPTLHCIINSYARAGHTSRSSHEVAAPTDDKVFFAGEHTSTIAGMAVHAAYDTGTAAATQVSHNMSSLHYHLSNANHVKSAFCVVKELQPLLICHSVLQ